MYNRNHMLAGGIRPHYYCLPILKHETDQKAIQKAAISGNPKFFAGTDSAPHPTQSKEKACGCAGIYSAPYALALYTQTFDTLNALKQLNSFTSRFGAEFYQLPINKEQITLSKTSQTVPNHLSLGNDTVIPMAAGDIISWSIDDA
jgi:dihydroorotase